MSEREARIRYNQVNRPLRTMTTNSRCMSFESALRKVKGKRRAAAWEGAAELAHFPLADFPAFWEDFLLSAARLRHHRSFERAIAAIGAPIANFALDRILQIPIRDQVPVIRIIGEALGSDALGFLERYIGQGPDLWGAALESMAISFPDRAEAYLRESLSRYASRTDRSAFAVALVRCATSATIEMLREYDLTDESCFLEELSTMAPERFQVVLEIAESAVSEALKSNELPWPLGFSDFQSALFQRRGPRVDAILEKLTDVSVWSIKRDAVCELARRGNARGLRLAREHCLQDKAIAEVAVTVAFSLGATVPFDWFAKIFLLPNAGDCESPAHCIRRRVLERLPACSDLRWNDLSCQLAPRDPNTAAQIRLQMTIEAVRELRSQLLSPDDKERVQAVIRLGEMKDVVVLPWIVSRVQSDDAISREEYFGFIEAIRQLGSAEGVAIIKRLMKRCSYSGFASEFAKETIELLDDGN